MPSPPQENSSRDTLEPKADRPRLTGSTADTPSDKSLEIRPQDEDAEVALTPQASRASQQLSLSRKVTSVGTTGTTDPNFEVDWDGENDPENPRNWSVAYRGMVLGFLSWNTLVV